MIIDSFLYGGENDIFISRINYLKNYVDFFVVVESNTTFSGLQREFKLKNLVCKFPQELQERIFVFENINFISSKTDLEILNYWPFSKSSNSIKAVFSQVAAQEYKPEVSFNEGYQRELIYFAINELIRIKPQIKITENDWIILSDLDEIPSINFINSINGFDKNNLYYCEMTEFVYSPNFIKKEKWIGSVAFNSKKLYENSIYFLRFMLKLNQIDRIPFEIINDEGWHLTSFGNLKFIKKKLDSWGHQELNTFINKMLVKFRIERGFDIFGRDKNIKYIHKNDILPQEILTSFLNEDYFIDYKIPTKLDYVVNKLACILDRFFRKFYIIKFSKVSNFIFKIIKKN